MNNSYLNTTHLDTKHLHNTIEEFDYVANRQEEKGIAKYGKPLDPMDNYDWLEMANEELVDAYKYFMAEKVKRQHCINKIRQLTNDSSIHILLDELEGRRKK